ncbi:IMPACT family protein [Corynebacterium heidelbergense]|uniref:YigZ family protein n=1 Tax=Corynebacterium heidelbergense TaxID=2055947 RepID=A0A364V7M7_9CORY|nr:YigZ family protein [Corynebacterium heidelbergense]RAV32645.1 YigZ family protein [Corynebacterium heidelbergense]
MPASTPQTDPTGQHLTPDESYLRPADGQWEATIEVRRSTFTAIARRVTSEPEARAFVEEVRKAYPDARHHCSAFILHTPGAQPVARSSDDGEPAGTAGQPMLDMLRGLQDVAVVVVRYFGGVLLGTGGLVRAYSDAVREVLRLVDVVRRQPERLFHFRLDHAEAGRVEAELRSAGEAGVRVVDVKYGRDVQFTVAGSGVPELVARLSGGRVSADAAGMAWVEVPVGRGALNS